MSDWVGLEREAPEIAEAGRRLLYQEQPLASGYLATVRKDGGPRVHPVSPILAGEELYVFVVEMSSKYRDLLRDPRFALHSTPTPEGGEEFYVTGEARPVDDPESRAAVTAATGGVQGNLAFEALFALDVERALYTKWTGWGTAQPWPAYHKWAANAAG